MIYRIRFIFFICIAFCRLDAQYFFGKNKIQLFRYNWLVLKSENFDIYYYPEEKALAHYTAELAERFFNELVFDFEFLPGEKIPIILYSSPNLFQETKTVPFILPENVGGFSDYIKGRIVLPFSGSFEEFKHTLKHELVHIFTFKYIEKSYTSKGAFYYVYPPLWLMEGLAEHLSNLYSPEMELILRSSTLDGSISSDLKPDQFGSGFTMYKLSQAFLLYLSTNYSTERIIKLFQNFLDIKQIDYTFLATFGKSFDQMVTEWIYFLRRKYFPYLSSKVEPPSAGREILKKAWIFSPVYWCRDSICTVIFKGSWMGYTGLYEFDGKSCRQILKGEFGEHFESFHGLTNRIDVNDSGIVVFSAKSRGRDVLYFYDIRARKIVFKKAFENIITINSPAFSPSADSVVFSGASYDGFFDIYLYILSMDTLINITSDIFDDRSPVFSPDGNMIIFSSSRRWANRGLYFYDLDSNKLIGVIEDEQIEFDEPRFSKDGKMVFVGRSLEFCDAFLARDGRVFKVTNITTGLFCPTFSPNGDSIVASCWWRDSYRLFEFGIKDTVFWGNVKNEVVESEKVPIEAEKNVASETVVYKKKLTLELAQGTVSTQSATESGGGLELFLTDMLGEHQIYFLFYSYAQTWKDLPRETNIYTTYTNRVRRFYWTAGLYHLFTRDYYSSSQTYEEESFGLLGAIAYPFSRFRRVETLVFLRYNSRLDFSPDRRYKGFLSTINLSYIKDNSQWDGVGPIDGSRSNITGGITLDLGRFDLYSSVLSMDLRRYFRLGERTTFAARLLSRSSFGLVPERYFLGGSWSIRGYPFFYFSGSKVYMLNCEFRFPLIERFVLKTPVLSLSFGGIKGAAYFDLGEAFEKEFVKPVGSFGLGMRINLAYYTVLRFDLSWKTDFSHISSSPVWDIFFGWDF